MAVFKSDDAHAVDGIPLYARVKRMISARIRSGDWPPRHRIPSENELVAELGVSRMTVNRALRELSQEGLLLRVQGSGTFVAESRLQSSVLEVRNIADEITERGHKHNSQVIVLSGIKATPEIAECMRCEIGGPVYHSVIIHLQDDIPVQLEERYVNPDVVPGYINQDFTQTTPNRFLTQMAPWTEVEHEIEAVHAATWEARLLLIGRADPCILIRRRTFADARVVTAVRMLVPGSRYTLKSRQISPTSATASSDP